MNTTEPIKNILARIDRLGIMSMDKSIIDYWKEDRRSYLADNAKPLEILVSHKVRVLERVI